ncbi:MAG: right-handed parallel beta-helix repeat-containing protein, partial [Patescibacteria group bacterium]|nr:right-handed parallel beta-helix repeat-containing protein [Patescibacteria group bacterium]
FLDQVNLHQINVTGCHISYNGGGGIVVRGGDVRNLHVAGCDIESNMDAEGPATANVLIDSRGGKFGVAEVSITGCTIQHNHLGADSANIRIFGNDDRECRWGHITIASNVLSDVQVNIDIRDARGVTVVGNTFWMGFGYDLRAIDCSNLVLSANNFDRNPHYDYGVALEAKGGILLENCRDSTITGLHVNGVHTHPAGIMIRGGSRLNVAQCTVLDCQHAGMLVEGLARSRITGCMIRNDVEDGGPWTAMVVEGGEENHLNDNTLGPDR